MNVLITGGNGMLASNLKEYFNQKNINYKLTTRVINKNDNFIITDYSEKSLNEIMKEFDVLIHLAGDRRQKESVVEYFDEIDLLFKLMANTKKYGYKKVLIASSISVYGSQDKLPYSEDQNITPKSNYAINKSIIERIALNYYNDSNIECGILRLSHMYGANERNNYMINLFLRKAYNKKEIVVSGASDVKREFLYVIDAVHAISCFLKSNFRTGLYNIKGSEILTNYEVAETINRVFGNQLITHINKDKKDTFSPSFLDGEKTYNEVSYLPKYTFEQSLLEIKIAMEEIDSVPDLY